MITTIDEIRTLNKVEAFETMVVQTRKGGLGGRMPPVVAVIDGV
jgi:hypothetical protein